MKTSILIFVIILLNLFTLKATAQNRKSHFKAIQISANVLYQNEAMKDYAIVIYSEGVKIDSVFMDDKEEFNILFLVNQSFTFVLKKTGYVTKTIMVDSRLPEGLKKLPLKANKIEITMMAKLGSTLNNAENFTDVYMIDKDLGVLAKRANEQPLQSNSLILNAKSYNY
jgi:hypothetical protein